MSIKGNAESFVELRGSLSLPEAIQGKSAYEIAVMHGFEGTEEEYVQWLKYGKDGADGKDGITPHIGENENWWIGNKDTGVSAIADVPYTYGTTDLVEGESELKAGHLYFVYEDGKIKRKITVTSSHAMFGDPTTATTTISMLDDGEWYEADGTVLVKSYEGGGANFVADCIPYVMYYASTGGYQYKYKIVNLISLDDVGSGIKDIYVEGAIVQPYGDGVTIAIEDALPADTIFKRILTVTTADYGAYTGETSTTLIEMADDGKEYTSQNTVSVGDYVGAGMCNRGKAYVLAKYNETSGAYEYRYLMAEVTSDAGILDNDPSAMWVVGKIYKLGATVTLTDVTE